MNGDNGDDTMSGGEGVDNVQGGRGNDTMWGGAGNDIMGGDNDDDTMFGDGGDDNMNGGKGNDFMDGGDDNDLMSGSNGNDTLLGRAGADVLNGGPQFDTCDVGPDGSSATKCENERPAASDVAIAAVEDGDPVVGSFVVVDPDGDAFSVTILTNPTEGTVTNNLNGTFTFSPGADFQDLAAGATRDVTFTYDATDIHGATSDAATVTVTVTGVDDPAVANDDDGGTTTEDVPITRINVLANDFDADDGEIVSVSGPPNGSETTGFQSALLASVFNNSDGTFQYDPTGSLQYLAVGESVTDSFTYEIESSNPASGTVSATVSILVTGLNDAPTADDGEAEGAESTTITITLTGTDPDTSDDLDFIVPVASDGGVVLANLVNNPGGARNSATVEYTAPAGAPPDSFTFTVKDNNGGDDTATVLINTPPPPDTSEDPPTLTGVDALEQVAPDSGPVDVTTATPVTITLEATAPFTSPPPAQDGDIGDLTFTIESGPSSGSVSTPINIVPNDLNDPVRSAMVTYTPAGVGATSFVFKACGEVLVGPDTGTVICDIATVEIYVDEAAATLPPAVTTLAASLNPGSITTIDLSAGDGSTGGTPECEPGAGRECPPEITQASSSGVGGPEARPDAAQAHPAPIGGPDIYFLVDVTGSMNDDLATIEDDIVAVIGMLENNGYSDARFGLGTYNDIATTPALPLFNNLVPLGHAHGVTDLIGPAGQDLASSTGGDLPEAQFFALDRLAGAANPAGFSSETPSVIVMIGDAAAHDPVCNAISGVGDISETSVLAALTDGDGPDIAVIANSIDGAGLDADPTAGSDDYEDDCGLPGGTAGQATRIAAATNGSSLEDATQIELKNAIVSAIAGPAAALQYSISLPAGFLGTVTDSNLVTYVAGQTAILPDSMLTYNSATVPIGTQQFTYTVTDLTKPDPENPGFFLSASENVYVSIVGTIVVVPDPCVPVGRPTGCVPI